MTAGTSVDFRCQGSGLSEWSKHCPPALASVVPMSIHGGAVQVLKASPEAPPQAGPVMPVMAWPP